MRQAPLILALFAFVCFQAAALPFFGGSPLRNTIMNAHATSSGVIDLKKDTYSDGSFYVEADLSSSYQTSKNSSSPANSTTNSSVSITDSVKFLVSIPNTETMVSAYCLSFSYYDCSRYNCYNYGWTKAIDFPTFSANVKYARSYVYLDYTYWGLNSAYLYIAQSCSGGSATGSNRYGVIGLGTDSSTKSDFTYDAVFSVLIDSDLQAGKLLIKKDTSKYAQTSSPLVSLSANSTWQVQASPVYIQVGYSSASFYGNIMFDFNSDAIGLPASLYSSILTYFQALSISCYSGYTYRPYCYTTKQLKDLPDITITVNSNNINIPSQIYATLSSDSGTYKYFYLNIKATSTAYSGKNYVSPSFANSIILDANFMSYYYTVFDATTGYNMIYLYPSTNAPSSPNFAQWIAAGAIAALLLVCLCTRCCCNKRKTVNNSSTVAAPLNNTTQAPVVYNQTGVVNNSAPYYSYDATTYNYNGYNYPAQPQVYQPYPPQPQGMYDPGYVPPPAAGN